MPEEGEVEEERTIDLFSAELSEEIDVKLTKAQLLYITSVVDAVAQPRGYQMIEFVYNLMGILTELNKSNSQTPVSVELEENVEKFSPSPAVESPSEQ